MLSPKVLTWSKLDVINYIVYRCFKLQKTLVGIELKKKIANITIFRVNMWKCSRFFMFKNLKKRSFEYDMVKLYAVDIYVGPISPGFLNP